ncbi:LOW QUALITY PROTEIN: ferritin subunit [Diaphorina citri]|uniref:Ferritin n=1 Tax=Diaphorina citri TaxID=121845 RepID=A0A3Q0J9X5_DIACI|nr:LOW QUALITY PROTEIN: ferritin subunit [Diaphorina citri]
MVHSCTNLMMQQVQKELNASLTYLAMGVHFSRDCVNRPGFAKFSSRVLVRSGGEHAIKFSSSYLTMRGNLTDYHHHVLSIIPSHYYARRKQDDLELGCPRVQDALNLETQVTESIRKIIIECEQGTNNVHDLESVNDYHLSDWLTGEFLDEQYKGQRKLAGMLSTMRKTEGTHGKLTEFLMDKEFL